LFVYYTNRIVPLMTSLHLETVKVFRIVMASMSLSYNSKTCGLSFVKLWSHTWSEKDRNTIIVLI